MLSFQGSFKWIYRYLASKELSAVLFVALCLVLILGTMTAVPRSYLFVPREVLLVSVGTNLFFCTLRRIKTLSRPVLIIHLGAMTTLAGAVISSFGFLATVNVYEGTTVDKIYRWDIGEEVPLGLDLTVKKVNMEYYPVSLKVGVLHGDQKVGLFLLRTGESFRIANYLVRADALELPSEDLKLSVFDEGGYIGSADTMGARDLPEDFPYAFVLVAFKNPSLKRMWLDLSLARKSRVIAEGVSEVNGPFSWESLNFYHVRVDHDEYGNRYAGIQITRDPGRPYVYSGFFVMGLGSLFYFISLAWKRYGKKKLYG